jgi:hypothetical protein
MLNRGGAQFLIIKEILHGDVGKEVFSGELAQRPSQKSQYKELVHQKMLPRGLLY